MKVETPLYYALMLARLASGQKLYPECDPGPALYPGTWNQYLAPNMGVRCQKASILFSDQDRRKNVTIEYGDVLCSGFPLMNITIPMDTPPGSGSIQMFCEGMEGEYCQMISVETRPPDDARKASATEYAITQDCPVIPTFTSENYGGASSKPTTVSTPTPKVVAPIGTAPTRAAMETPANQAPTNQTPTSETPTSETPTGETPTKELSDTKLPKIDADKPDSTGSGRSGSSDTDSATSTTNGDMPSGTTSPLTGSQAAGSGAAQMTQSPEYTDIAAPALPESAKTHAPPSPSNEAQASGDNRPCTCGQ